jgi:group I intron endonuclease
MENAFMAEQYDIFGGKSYRDKIGIYAISHTPSRSIYIGQSNNIEQRLNKHITELKKTVHPNSNLQKLWEKYGIVGFNFLLLEELTDNKSSLETQRWLSLKEKFWIAKFRQTENITTLNITEGEIVKTTEAIIEFKKELFEKKKNKIKLNQNFDLQIKLERKSINFRLQEIEKSLQELRSNRKLHSPKLKSLYQQLDESKTLLDQLQKKHNWFFRFFYGHIDSDKESALKAKIIELSSECDSIYRPILNEINSLENERESITRIKNKLHSSKKIDYYNKLRARGGINSHRTRQKQGDFY